LSASSALALEVTEDTTEVGTISLDVGDITVDAGVYYSIINNALSAIVGNLDVEGSFYITSTSDLIALTVTLDGVINSIVNNGLVSFNSAESLTAPTYQLAGISFENNGEFYLGGDGSVGVPIMAITSLTFNNNGLMVFYQNQRSTGVVTLGAPAATIHNNGQICLYNEIYQQTTAVDGTGCITAQADSSVFISNALVPFAQTQTIYLESDTASVRATAISTPQTFTVANFGNGNIIGLDIPLVTLPGLSSYSYDATSGILTLRGAGLLSQKFDIGTGYDTTLFSITTDPGLGLVSVPLGAVTYSGPPPTPGQPDACQACKPLPPTATPGAEPTEYTTTFTTTEPDGSVETESGVVLISTDDSGSWFTTTSLFPESTAEPTEYTTTFTTTEPDGSVETESEPSNAEPTEYTTTFATTEPDGSVETETATPASVAKPATTVAAKPETTAGAPAPEAANPETTAVPSVSAVAPSPAEQPSSVSTFEGAASL
ncbi:hyphally regulated cell wall protein, partial [Scheffersomyces stipitis CBS 6054]